ncbi:MAG: hypothetical protein J6N70_16980 [Oribacterium sp.]|nr:hypothetical protein [Oribacterium sp.]
MAYRVVKVFADSQDNGRIYQVGEIFPRPDFAVSDARLSQLASSSNAVGVPLIEKLTETHLRIEKTDQIETEQKGQGISLADSEEALKDSKAPSKRGRKKKVDVNA